MMQLCASAAKLRSGGPILPIGMKAKGHVGIPPPRTIIGALSQANGQDGNCRDTFRWGNRPASLWIAEDFGCCASG
jgi:hypothetical protein